LLRYRHITFTTKNRGKCKAVPVLN
jgi:hypothetical protein